MLLADSRKMFVGTFTTLFCWWLY